MTNLLKCVAQAVYELPPESPSMEIARIALEAMRNPTDAMFGGQYGVLPRKQFTDMINAALRQSSYEAIPLVDWTLQHD